MTDVHEENTDNKNCFDGDSDNNKTEEVDGEVKELMKSHSLDRDSAEKVQEIIDDYGLDEDDAIELTDDL